jgi:hypothetical protein
MKARTFDFVRAGLAASMLAVALGAGATQAGKTAQGLAYLSGGVSLDERAVLQAQGSGYSLWVVTAAMKSGAYLSKVHVTIRDAKQIAVFDGQLDGPWLFVDLPLGRYEVQAVFNGATHKRVTTIHPGDHHQALFYFTAGD